MKPIWGSIGIIGIEIFIVLFSRGTCIARDNEYQLFFHNLILISCIQLASSAFLFAMAGKLKVTIVQFSSLL